MKFILTYIIAMLVWVWQHTTNVKVKGIIEDAVFNLAFACNAVAYDAAHITRGCCLCDQQFNDVDIFTYLNDKGHFDHETCCDCDQF